MLCIEGRYNSISDEQLYKHVEEKRKQFCNTCAYACKEYMLRELTQSWFNDFEAIHRYQQAASCSLEISFDDDNHIIAQYMH